MNRHGSCQRYLCLAVMVGVLSCRTNTPPASLPEQPSIPAAAEPVPVEPPFRNAGGMWMPEQMGAHAGQLKRLGLELDPQQLADLEGYPLGAVVFLGGCSASFVSADGLVITNHHCAVGALQYNSRPGRDLVQDGFVARTRAEEKSNGPQARVYVTHKQTDITEPMLRGLAAIADDRARFLEVERRTKQQIADCEERRAHRRCEVSKMFGGARYFLLERLEIKDVRLVYAPPDGTGRFGGETDNWQWPRHTGDYAFYRAYVAKDGTPRAYSADNVPYRPSQHLRIARAPLREGELVFVAGYPNRTDQFATPFEINELVSWYFPRQIEYCKENIAIIEAVSAGDKDAELKGVPAIRGLANWQKFMQGAHEGLLRGGAFEAKAKDYRDLKAWLAKHDERASAEVLEPLQHELAKRAASRGVRTNSWEILGSSTLFGAANQIVRLAKERLKPDADRKPDYQDRNLPKLRGGLEALQRRYSEKIDAARLALALRRVAKEPAAERSQTFELVAGKARSAEQLGKRVETLLKSTKLNNKAIRLKLLEADWQTIQQNQDPLIALARRLLAVIEELEAQDEAFEGRLLLLRPRYFALLQKVTEKPLAPDANRTLRLTYGVVKGYRPTPDRQTFPAFTKLSEIVKKHTGQAPFDAPRELLSAIKSRQFGPYQDSVLGEVPVNFVADLHITGGNSGSPTLNARGELVGLAFDGNYEAMASDWLFMPDPTRSIHVDIRYVLWLMDAVDATAPLLREMGIEPALSKRLQHQLSSVSRNFYD